MPIPLHELRQLRRRASKADVRMLALLLHLISIEMMGLIERVSDFRDPRTREGIDSLLAQLDEIKVFSEGLALPEGPEGLPVADAS